MNFTELNISHILTSESDYFAPVFEKHYVKSMVIAFGLFLYIVDGILLKGVTWYEKYGADAKRSLKNRIISLLIMYAMWTYSFFIPIYLLRVFIKLPVIICDFGYIGSNSFPMLVRKCTSVL